MCNVKDGERRVFLLVGEKLEVETPQGTMTLTCVRTGKNAATLHAVMETVDGSQLIPRRGKRLQVNVRGEWVNDWTVDRESGQRLSKDLLGEVG